MSRKLRLPVLGWMSWRTNKQACAILGIPLDHFVDWIGNDAKILRDEYQAKCLANAEIMAKWADIERRGGVL